MKFTRSRSIVAGLTAAAALAGLPATAAAQYGNVYLVVGNHNCPAGGSITGIAGAVGDTWSTAGDWGDNIVYPRVRMNTTNTFNGRAFCNRPWYRGGSYWTNVAWKEFRPTRHGGTHWI